MSSDLYFNGTAWPGRSGNNKYGTFWTQVQPWALGSTFQPMENPDFEIFGGGFFTGWTVASFNPPKSNWSRETTIVQNGAASFHVFKMGTGGTFCSLQQTNGDDGNWTGTRTFTFNGWVYGTAGEKVVFKFQNTGGSDQGSVATFILQSTGTWEFLEYSFDSGFGAQFSRTMISFPTSPPVGGTTDLYIDNLFLSIAPVATCQTMDYNWAARMVENTGRAKGLSGYGTIPIGGIATISFPPGFFKYSPIIEAFEVQIGVRKNQEAEIQAGTFITWKGFTTVNRNFNNFLIVHQNFPQMKVGSISGTGCLIWPIWHGEPYRVVQFYWHAFGL